MTTVWKTSVGAPGADYTIESCLRGPAWQLSTACSSGLLHHALYFYFFLKKEKSAVSGQSQTKSAELSLQRGSPRALQLHRPLLPQHLL